MNPIKFQKFSICLLTLCFFVLPLSLHAQAEKQKLSLQDIFASQKFLSAFFQRGQWAETGPVITFTRADSTGVTHLLSLDLERDEEQTLLNGNDLHAPDVDRLITIEGYQFNHDRSKALLYTDSAPVWRKNTKGYYYIYDLAGADLTPLSARDNGYQMFAKFSPDGKYVGFVRNRNLYLVELATMQETELTSNGADGAIINGTTDWVYEEELGLRDGWSWSPDGKHLAFYQFDESRTNEFLMLDLRGKKPEEISFRFPLAGEPNSEVRIGVIEIANQKTRFFETGTWNQENPDYEYILRMGWTPKIDGRRRVWMLRSNRDQNKADLIYGDPEDSQTRIVLTEQEDTWVEVINYFGGQYLTYLKDGEHFIWVSERDGFKHIYLYRNNGEFVRQLTSGDWRVTTIHGVDEEAGQVYFTGAKSSPLERQLYAAPLLPTNGRELRRITQSPGTHVINLSSDFGYFIDTFSTINTPPITRLYNTDGALIKELETNTRLVQTLQEYDLPEFELLTVKAADGETDLHGYLLKPDNLDASEPYPLLIFTYGGPGVQVVHDAWQGMFGLWHQYMATEHGFIVVCFDNRGAAGYGKAFQSANHLRLGTLEVQDQLAVARHFAARPYVDAQRIGMWGWSYGGYNTLNAMLKYDGPNTIKAGVAVAPGIDHELYDTIYTERYMSTPQKNAKNYVESSPKNFAHRLRDEQKLLIVQGDLDDNVHFQQTVHMVSALQKANKHFQLMIYPGGNHGMVGTGNPLTYLHLFTMITDFFTENLE